MTAFAVLGLLGGLLLLFSLSRYDQHGRARVWEALAPDAQAALRELSERYELERSAAAFSYAAADTARAHGDVDEAMRLLDVGYRYLACLADDRRSCLREMRVYSRLVTAMVPLPPLRPSQFRLAELRRLMGLGGLAHYFLVAVTERFRLRLWLLSRGFSLATRALVPGRNRVEQARADFVTLEDETLASATALVEALAATPLRAPAQVER